MNAYELADWLYKWCEGKPYPTQNLEIVSMLCKQADRIAELEKSVKQLSDEQILGIYSQCCDLGNGGIIAFAKAIIKEITE